ncbi:MAG: hypothetical protein HKM98_11005 [Gammaproteobacteria bacterium]|nr:hypothetical protein [Gammaproteobacteria bacterium]
MPAKRFPLPRRFNAAMSEKAYSRLRELSAEHGYGNNYLLTVLLENLDRVVKKRELEKVFREFEAEFGAPAPGSMAKKGN